MSEPKKHPKPFARVILANLGILVVVFAARVATDAPGFILLVLLSLALLNIVLAFDADYNEGAHLLSAFVFLLGTWWHLAHLSLHFATH